MLHESKYVLKSFVKEHKIKKIKIINKIPLLSNPGSNRHQIIPPTQTVLLYKYNAIS